MPLLEFTGTKGKAVWINPAYVAAVESGQDPIVHFAYGGLIVLTGNATDIVDRINQALPSVAELAGKKVEFEPPKIMVVRCLICNHSYQTHIGPGGYEPRVCPKCNNRREV